MGPYARHSRQLRVATNCALLIKIVKNIPQHQKLGSYFPWIYQKFSNIFRPLAPALIAPNNAKPTRQFGRLCAKSGSPTDGRRLSNLDSPLVSMS